MITGTELPKKDEKNYLKDISSGIGWMCIWLFFIAIGTCSNSDIISSVDELTSEVRELKEVIKLKK